MPPSSSGLVSDPGWVQSLLLHSIDVGLVLALTYLVLLIIGERRTLWMVRGLIVLMLAAAVSNRLGLTLLSFVLEKLVVGSAVAMAVIFQSEFRRFLEQLGRGEIVQLFQAKRRPIPKPDSVIDEIVDAVKELSQNRTGALMIMETNGPVDERDFSVPGVQLNAEVSKELLQTIFQTTTLLHDGAVLIRGSRVAAAGVILPLSERTASRQLGTRHRAAMGITERVENCLCIVVSEETGSISLAERGGLNRPLTSSKLKELLETRFSKAVDREAVAPGLRSLGRQVKHRGRDLISRFFRRLPPTSHKKK
ncbi:MULTISPECIES: diadenylate cyclase CdaA [unclassified Coleofasciculus]|uniref:diadenylate cyclase CdaA n=1 Tax=unclassified Coleofasciculus TaxID=2692782 RepID=UPI00187FE2FF|nr:MULTISPECIES: diadenylate cyclase CdaA [unclassified Coleofasciculus]MBE9127086.1 TIGR00159 family protein [Coleofasciculus sp. LEGE 07081]MBE9150474.1 TIGR00159 family protein [Coleofasciculus sp. LEGE 07092]